MDQVTKVKRHLKQEQWKALINDCQSSKMTVAAWCKVNGICEQTYYRNLKRLREQLCETISIPSESLENPTTFKKIEITSPLLFIYKMLLSKFMKEHVCKPYKQCWQHSKAYVRRYQCC